MTNKQLKKKIEKILFLEKRTLLARDYLISLTKEYALSVLPEEIKFTDKRNAGSNIFNAIVNQHNQAIKQAKENIK